METWSHLLRPCLEIKEISFIEFICPKFTAETIKVTFAKGWFSEHDFVFVVIKTDNDALLAKEVGVEADHLIADCGGDGDTGEVHLAQGGQSAGEEILGVHLSGSGGLGFGSEGFREL
jgi:hypothetical protein